MEQGTGVEPAFTAWEAVVLPIYEPCVAAIIADSIVKFKGNLPQTQIPIYRAVSNSHSTDCHSEEVGHTGVGISRKIGSYKRLPRRVS